MWIKVYKTNGFEGLLKINYGGKKSELEKLCRQYFKILSTTTTNDSSISGRTDKGNDCN